MKFQTDEPVEYIITRESDDDVLQYENDPEFEENLVEEYLTEEIEAPDDAFDEDPFGATENDSIEAVYTCNACGIEITNVQEHINEFHSDQEIIVDMGEKQKLDDYSTVVYKQEPGVELDSDTMNGFTFVEEDDSQYALVNGDEHELDENSMLVQTETVPVSVDQSSLIIDVNYLFVISFAEDRRQRSI